MEEATEREGRLYSFSDAFDYEHYNEEDAELNDFNSEENEKEKEEEQARRREQEAAFNARAPPSFVIRVPFPKRLETATTRWDTATHTITKEYAPQEEEDYAMEVEDTRTNQRNIQRKDASEAKPSAKGANRKRKRAPSGAHGAEDDVVREERARQSKRPRHDVDHTFDVAATPFYTDSAPPTRAPSSTPWYSSNHLRSK